MGGKSLPRQEVEDGFIPVLKQNRLKKDVGALIKAVFDKVWQEEVANFRTRAREAELKKNELDEKVKQLSEMALNTKSLAVRRAYEDSIEEAMQQIDGMNGEMQNDIDLTIPYGTALDKAIGLLQNPYEIWKTLDVKQKQGLYFFIFEQKMPSSKKTGYGTAEIASAVRLFEDFAMQNTPEVEMPGIEPGSKKKVTLGLRV
jgi:hypothetical protein